MFRICWCWFAKTKVLSNEWNNHSSYASVLKRKTIEQIPLLFKFRNLSKNTNWQLLINPLTLLQLWRLSWLAPEPSPPTPTSPSSSRASSPPLCPSRGGDRHGTRTFFCKSASLVFYHKTLFLGRLIFRHTRLRIELRPPLFLLTVAWPIFVFSDN